MWQTGLPRHRQSFFWMTLSFTNTFHGSFKLKGFSKCSIWLAWLQNFRLLLYMQPQSRRRIEIFQCTFVYEMMNMILIIIITQFDPSSPDRCFPLCSIKMMDIVRLCSENSRYAAKLILSLLSFYSPTRRLSRVRVARKKKTTTATPSCTICHVIVRYLTRQSASRWQMRDGEQGETSWRRRRRPWWMSLLKKWKQLTRIKNDGLLCLAAV